MGPLAPLAPCDIQLCQAEPSLHSSMMSAAGSIDKGSLPQGMPVLSYLTKLLHCIRRPHRRQSTKERISCKRPATNVQNCPPHFLGWRNTALSSATSQSRLLCAAELLLHPEETKVTGCTQAACGAEFTMWVCSGKLYSAGNPQYGVLGHGTDHEYNAKDCE